MTTYLTRSDTLALLQAVRWQDLDALETLGKDALCRAGRAGVAHIKTAVGVQLQTLKKLRYVESKEEDGRFVYRLTYEGELAKRLLLEGAPASDTAEEEFLDANK